MILKAIDININKKHRTKDLFSIQLSSRFIATKNYFEAFFITEERFLEKFNMVFGHLKELDKHTLRYDIIQGIKSKTLTVEQIQDFMDGALLSKGIQSSIKKRTGHDKVLQNAG